jgi:hypothetical protein
MDDNNLNFYEVDFSDRFNTKLSKKEETEFLKWAEENNRLADLREYDMRGWWKEFGNKRASFKMEDGQHFPDTYKKPSHPTFSDQSIYNGAMVADGIPIYGGTWGEDYYQPSATMLRFMQHPQFLQDYFKKVEPNMRLMLPQQ